MMMNCGLRIADCGMAAAALCFLTTLSGCIQYPGTIPSGAKRDYVYCFYSPFHRRLTTQERDDLQHLWHIYSKDYAAAEFYSDWDNYEDDPDCRKMTAAFNAMNRDEAQIEDEMNRLFQSKTITSTSMSTSRRGK